jgi:hypothetical protein
MLIDVVAQEAKARGLTCERADVRNGLQTKCVLIGGYACQIVPLRLYQTGKNSDLIAYSLYLPRSDWPDFIIYVFANRKETARFFIVPRGVISKETGVCAQDSWLFKYENAWTLLSPGIESARLARRFDMTPWKPRVVIRRAKALGLDVRLIRTKKLASRHIKDRLLINSCKCQVITAGGLTAKNRETPIINLYAPKNSWADFLIFVALDTVEHVFIVPRSKITRRTTTTLTSKWLAEYADNWDAVIARDPAYESRSAVIDDPAVQAEVVQAKDTDQRIAGEDSTAPHQCEKPERLREKRYAQCAVCGGYVSPSSILCKECRKKGWRPAGARRRGRREHYKGYGLTL